jgi:hypothetical protein
MEHRRNRLRRTVSTATAVVAAATVAFAVAPAAVAAPAAKAPAGTASVAKLAEREGHLKPAAGGVGTRSAGGGAHSGDFTTDFVHDILARNATNGQLNVYPHSGTYNGTATFQPGVTINYGWGGIRWIGQGDLTADGYSDVLYIDAGGVMRLAPHSGVWNGTGTLLAGQVVGTGWGINDMVFTDDWDFDGYDDVLARRAGTGEVYLYRNTGLGGLSTFDPPLLAVTGPADDVELTMGDFTLDGSTDLLFVQSDGVMGVFDFMTGENWAIGYGWETINAITLADVNVDGVIDVLGRRRYDNTLVAYTHAGWFPDYDTGTAFGTLSAPVLMGYNWNINNVIT